MNVIYIHTHDTGRVISPLGYKVPTPNYETLFSDSLVFQDAYSVAPTCSPSRAGLLTGVYPHQNGMLGLAQRGFKFQRELHLANFLSKHGYTTVLSGVQHEYAYYTRHDLAYEKLGYQYDITADHTPFTEAELTIWDQQNAQNVKTWLDNYDGKKLFFLSYGMHATHRKFPEEIDEDINVDFSIPPSFVVNNEMTREDFARYKTSARVADECLGTVVEALKENGLYEETIIIVTTDHGIAYPFGKCNLNKNGIGVLLAIRVPESKQKESTYDDLISQIDIFPTLCDLLDLEKPSYLEGQSFVGLFEGEDVRGKEEVFAEVNFHTSYEPIRTIRTKQYSYIRYFDDYLNINFSNVDNSEIKDYLYHNGLKDYQKDPEALYDLILDPEEKVNRINDPKYFEVAKDLRNRLQNFMERTNDPLLDGPIEVLPEWKVNTTDCYSASSKDPKDYVSMGGK